jgi:tetratricopeptide (TPR) repeat protein
MNLFKTFVATTLLTGSLFGSFSYAQSYTDPERPTGGTFTRFSAEDFFNRGVEKYDKGDKKGALQEWNKAIEVNPTFTKAYANRSIVHAELGDKKGAAEDYKTVESLLKTDYLNALKQSRKFQR